MCVAVLKICQTGQAVSFEIGLLKKQCLFFLGGGGGGRSSKIIFSGKNFLAHIVQLRCAEFLKKYKIGCGCALLCSLDSIQAISIPLIIYLTLYNGRKLKNLNKI